MFLNNHKKMLSCQEFRIFFSKSVTFKNLFQYWIFSSKYQKIKFLMNTGQVKAFKLATLRSQYKFYFEIPVHEF